eukprot:1158566-Pelagomonas_calceolata.AAC.2
MQTRQQVLRSEGFQRSWSQETSHVAIQCGTCLQAYRQAARRSATVAALLSVWSLRTSSETRALQFNERHSTERIGKEFQWLGKTIDLYDLCQHPYAVKTCTELHLNASAHTPAACAGQRSCRRPWQQQQQQQQQQPGKPLTATVDTVTYRPPNKLYPPKMEVPCEHASTCCLCRTAELPSSLAAAAAWQATHSCCRYCGTLSTRPSGTKKPAVLPAPIAPADPAAADPRLKPCG